MQFALTILATVTLVGRSHEKSQERTVVPSLAPQMAVSLRRTEFRAGQTILIRGYIR